MQHANSEQLLPIYNRTGRPTITSADLVIIGNGIAGLTAAVTARGLAPEASIVIVTAQNHPTINTPALKQFAVGRLTREQLLAYPAGTERAQSIHVIHARAEKINARQKQIVLENGNAFGYDKLLLATGCQPTKLSNKLPGHDFDGVLALHRLPDYLELRRRLAEVQEAVVIGGGTHACETVMGLLHWNIRVHWLIRSATFMANMLDQTASRMVLDRVKQAGALIYTETEAAGIVGRVGCVAGLITNQQQFIPCQLVVSCTGTKPTLMLAQQCDPVLKTEKAILVDRHLRSSVRDIYVAGDAAALKNPLTGKYEPRPQWFSAVEQGRAVAAQMTGQQEEPYPFGVPWHATQLGELSMLSVGAPLSTPEGAQSLTDGSRGNYRRLTVADDRLIGYLSLGQKQPDSLAIKRIIDDGLSVRDMLKPLLKGNFDARHYLSRRSTHAARNLVTTGYLGSVQPKMTVPLPVPPSATPDPRRGAVREQNSGEIARTATVVPAKAQAPSSFPILYEGEPGPFTGDLPSLSPEVAHPIVGALAAEHYWLYSDRAPSGNVPAQAPVAPSRRNLWSYSQQREEGR